MLPPSMLLWCHQSHWYCLWCCYMTVRLWCYYFTAAVFANACDANIINATVVMPPPLHFCLWCCHDHCCWISFCHLHYHCFWCRYHHCYCLSCRQHRYQCLWTTTFCTTVSGAITITAPASNAAANTAIAFDATTVSATILTPSQSLPLLIMLLTLHSFWYSHRQCLLCLSQMPLPSLPLSPLPPTSLLFLWCSHLHLPCGNRYFHCHCI